MLVFWSSVFNSSFQSNLHSRLGLVFLFSGRRIWSIVFPERLFSTSDFGLRCSLGRMQRQKNQNKRFEFFHAGLFSRAIISSGKIAGILISMAYFNHFSDTFLNRCFFDFDIRQIFSFWIIAVFLKILISGCFF